jgi:hypothetical protein
MRIAEPQEQLQRRASLPNLGGDAETAAAGTAHPLLSLQRTLGNRAVRRLLQARNLVQ